MLMCASVCICVHMHLQGFVVCWGCLWEVSIYIRAHLDNET
jgi:hypothetical protein